MNHSSEDPMSETYYCGNCASCRKTLRAALSPTSPAPSPEQGG